MDYVSLIIIGIVVLLYIKMSFRIANENERFAVYALGRFAGLKGPGLVLKMPGGSTRFVRITLGDEGEIHSNELALFAGNVIPYKASAPVKVGSKVRVTGFEKATVQVETLQQFVVCEKCGHKNAV